MKRFFALMMSAMMICSVFVCNSSAKKGAGAGGLLDVPIWSREEPETPPEKPRPDHPEPGAEKPDKPEPGKPEGEKPVSPQTGYPIGIVGLSATAAACGAAAVIAGKKASKR